jgi:F-type H+-transporting ATPase subunit gamma
MPSLKDLKNRIGSVKSTQKITSAMKMVAAAKLRKAQEQALASRPYTSLMDKVVSKIASKMSGNTIDLLTGKTDNKTQLIVVFSADRGLCGGFNGSITRAVRAEIKKLEEDGITVKLLMVGKKSADALNREFGHLFVERIDGNSAKPNYTDAEIIAKKIISLFEDNEFGVCKVIFNKFVSAITQEVTFKSLIPADIQETETDEVDSNSIYEFEPSEEEILNDLLPRNLATQLFSSQMESTASELAARMTAMDNATRNAGDMIDNLTLQYNRTSRSHPRFFERAFQIIQALSPR